MDHDIKVLEQGMFYGIGPEDDAFPSVPLVAGFVTGDGDHLIACWLPWHPQEYTPDPARISLELSECSFDRPVRIDLLSGKVYQLDDPETKTVKQSFTISRCLIIHSSLLSILRLNWTDKESEKEDQIPTF